VAQVADVMRSFGVRLEPGERFTFYGGTIDCTVRCRA